MAIIAAIAKNEKMFILFVVDYAHRGCDYYYQQDHKPKLPVLVWFVVCSYWGHTVLKLWENLISLMSFPLKLNHSPLTLLLKNLA